MREVGTPEAIAGSYAFLAYIVGSVALLVLAIPYGEGGFTKRDVACFILAMVSIGLWKTLDNPQLALIMQIIANILGAVPMMSQAWTEPWKADFTTWTLFLAGGLFNTLTVENWAPQNWMTWLPPAHILVLQVIIIWPLIIYRRRMVNVNSKEV